MILYIGNSLSDHGFSPSTMETILPLLSKDFNIKGYSKKSNQIVRLFDMVFAIIKHRREATLVLIDVYSTRAFYFFVITAALCKLFRIPYVPILHGGNLPNRLRKNRKLTAWLFSTASNTVSPSEYLSNAVKELGLNVQVIPNFIIIENYPFKNRNHIQPKLLWVRAFHEIYNPELAIKILKELKENYPDAELCMVGPDKDGSLSNVMELVKRWKLEDRVIITGKLGKKEWIDLSKNYDIFINTTNYDNMPISVIEAMALGLVVVSTNVGGLPYLIKHNYNGLLVEKNDLEGFLNSITETVDILDFKLVINARTGAESYSWLNVKQLWFELINKNKLGSNESA